MKIENWNNHEIRFVDVDGEWWAVANDIAKAMGFRDSNVALRKMPNKYKGQYKVRTPGGIQKMMVLTEKGLYRLIMRSNKPEAEAFQDWVFDVIKQLRQATGLEGFEVFRMMDKQHQKDAMKRLRDGLKRPVRVNFIKANTVANKAVSNKYGYSKMVKKGEMTPAMLVDREAVLDDTVKLMKVNDEYKLGISVSKAIYRNLQPS
ncbi:phage repressor protein [Lentilactobacillus parafarraginis]|uniref:Phage repressor protein n=1 Tax=Lentilactobacillus parafarraginis TaxID=390842 RepID=A0A5R9CXM2_9LACO|nr:BRO family protein [Lentilactobacillus parafarraginis]TLQ20459.1 phage repressor protein [Lentilactobacillus parafarraginis]